MIKIRHYATPIGEIILGSFADKLCVCDWLNSKHRKTCDEKIRRALRASYTNAESATVANAVAQLEQYFAKERTSFDIPLLFTGSDFQNVVCAELLKIGYGQTISYGELAKRLKNPRAVRAVANAVAGNPMSIFVPCHRVIGANGTLTGYAGGLKAKEFLLRLESQ